MTPSILALSLLSTTPTAQAATGFDEWMAWAQANRVGWVARYELALASGNHRARIAILEALAELLGISTSEVQQLLQTAMVTGEGILGMLIIDPHTDARRDAAWGDVAPDVTASMSIGIPHDPGAGDQPDGEVTSDCIGGTDEHGNPAECGKWAMSAPVESVTDALTGDHWCLAHVSDRLSLAVAGECDEWAGQTVHPDGVLVWLD